MKQFSFDNNSAFKDFKKRSEHGGGIRKGKRKLSRPFNNKKALHLILRSEQAQGSRNMLRGKFEPTILRCVYKLGAQFHIEICEFANSGNHLHLLIKSQAINPHQAKLDFQNFLRTLSALVARLVTGAKKGKPFEKRWNKTNNTQENQIRQPIDLKKKRFWDSLAYTRIVNFGREFSQVSRYILLNKLEAWQFIPSNKRKKFQKFSYEDLASLIPMRRGLENFKTSPYRQGKLLTSLVPPKQKFY